MSDSAGVLVDLGHAVARIKHVKYATGVVTTMTIMTPALAEDGVTEPAYSAEACMRENQLRALIEALQQPFVSNSEQS